MEIKRNDTMDRRAKAAQAARSRGWYSLAVGLAFRGAKGERDTPTDTRAGLAHGLT